MAIARLSVKVGKVGKAAAHANYISRGDAGYAQDFDRDNQQISAPEQQTTPEKLPFNYQPAYETAPDSPQHLNQVASLHRQPSLFAAGMPQRDREPPAFPNDDLSYSEHGNMPAWAQHDPQEFWKAADLYERKNGSTYREYELALPRELNERQRIELVRSFVQQEIGTKYPYQLAIHNPTALDGGEQPHAHVMFSERKLDGIARDPQQHFKRYNPKNPERGGAKKDNPTQTAEQRIEALKALRQRWEHSVNQQLERAGRTERIDMRSYQAQGIERQPERKYLPSEIRQPDSKQQLIDFRQAREQAQHRVYDAHSLQQGMGSTLKRFEAYKRNQSDMAQEQQQTAQRERERERELSQQRGFDR